MDHNNSIQWLDRRTLLIAHEAQLVEHGGLRGFRDEGLFDSALIRPQQILHYKADATLAELSAAYAFGITRNHPFTDGNKRAAYIALDTFCRINGWLLQANEVEIFETMMALAAGELTEEVLAVWISQHLVPLAAKP